MPEMRAAHYKRNTWDLSSACELDDDRLTTTLLLIIASSVAACSHFYSFYCKAVSNLQILTTSYTYLVAGKILVQIFFC